MNWWIFCVVVFCVVSLWTLVVRQRRSKTDVEFFVDEVKPLRDYDLMKLYERIRAELQARQDAAKRFDQNVDQLFGGKDQR